MKKTLIALLVLIITVVSTSCVYSNIDFNEEELIALAKTQVADMVNGDFSTTAECFNKKVASSLDEQALESAWNGVVASMGEYISQYSLESKNSGKYFVVTIVEEYEATGLKITISYDANSEIGGIYFNYQTIKKDAVKNESFEEIEVTIGDEFPLDAILTLPVGVEKPPVLLLVPGSGLVDKNATISVNAVFLDMAQSLAEKGIASLRFDKRFYAHPEQYTKLGFKVTFDDEILEDVDFALDFLVNNNQIDKENIFVLGHSMGGGLTPYIASANENVKGIISMAGTLNPLYEVSFNQNLAIEKEILNGDYDEDTINTLNSQMKQVRKDVEILRGDMSGVADDKVLMGMYACYQKSGKFYAGENFIDDVKVPILVLQGGADFQVLPTIDYPLWESALKGRENAECKFYEDLNHLMMKTSGKLDVSDYQIKGNVDERVINDITNFVLK